MNKVEFIKALNEIVLGLGDEDLIDLWLMNGVPDQPSEEDFEFIANDQESFDDLINLFVRLSKYISIEGINIEGKWYKG